MSDIVNTLWGFCHTLRHDGMDYGDYIEQITYLLFLKMADEKEIAIPSYVMLDESNKKTEVPCNWDTLKGKAGADLLEHYNHVLNTLKKEKGLLGDIFRDAQARFNNPVNLKKVINMIDQEEWTAMEVDVKGAAFEGLLEKSAAEGKKGAGQFFTPRPLIKSICRVMKPDPRKIDDYKICDPACGTGGFLMYAYEWLMDETKGALNRDIIKRIRTSTYYGQDLVARPRRLALMNMFLHGIEPQIYLGDTIYDPDRNERYDCILTNPPFGTKGASQAPEREDFTVETSNKQLNFVQHILTILKPGGRAAIVLPDNCLFEDKAADVFKIVMQDCNVHTILRLPRGTFTPYSQGVKANVVFLKKGLPTENVWIFDGRSNVEGITKKDRPLTEKHFEEFEKCYGDNPNGTSERKDLGETGRFRKFHITEIVERGYKLDITWLKDESAEDSENLPEPLELIGEAQLELESVLSELNDLFAMLEGDGDE